MNICFVNPTQKIQSGLKGLTKALAAKGHKIIVLTPKTLREDELEDIASTQIVVYPSVFVPKIRYTLPFFLSQLRILKNIVDREEIDLIYLYKYFYPAVWIPLIYAKIRNIPIILITDSFPGISWRYGDKFVDTVARIYSKTIGRLVLRLCDRVIVFSPALLEPCRNMGVKECKLLVIPKGVDFTHYSLNAQSLDIRKSFGISQDEVMILNVGRLVPVKGVSTLIQITEKLLDDGYKVKTIIVGDGPYKTKYERMAAGLKQNIIFTGFRRDIPKLLSACDVFVLPSLSEGTPSAILEAAACGKPVVASNVGGIPDAVIHGETGFLVGPADVNSFVHYIELLLNDKDLACRLGGNIYEHVRSNFDWGVIIKSYEEVCQQVIQSKKAS